MLADYQHNVSCCKCQCVGVKELVLPRVYGGLVTYFPMDFYLVTQTTTRLRPG